MKLTGSVPPGAGCHVFVLASTSRLAASLSLLLVANEWIPRFLAFLGFELPLLLASLILRVRCPRLTFPYLLVFSPGCRRSRLVAFETNKRDLCDEERAFALRLE